MNHGGMDHGGMDHGGMDHGGMGHGGMSSQCKMSVNGVLEQSYLIANVDDAI